MISDALKKNKEFIKDLDQEIRRVNKTLTLIIFIV